MTRLDDDPLSVVLAGWLCARTALVTPKPQRYRTVIAVDGKTLRGARRSDGRQVHLGATLKELMARIGHSSTRAAMIYQHATRDRDHAIAAALDALIEEAGSKINA
ncbi:hypothetical protein [Dactylosporangium fulvum]|uniref:Integrase n=1 Tax=Dactylosporangium fulvum TaxID=53359 RepID=A0ABY5WEC7_9ACTN|nr:hypothetical protein [Dactylosporangium fulvum]UWP87778.1 hypothetical protein Dfulv_42890 [Dactylosporangium fulvum]